MLTLQVPTTGLLRPDIRLSVTLAWSCPIRETAQRQKMRAGEAVYRPETRAVDSGAIPF